MRISKQAITAGLLGSLVLGSAASAVEFPDWVLAAKRMFGQQEEAAVREPFVGIRTSDGIEPDLYHLGGPGASTEEVRVAAEALLDSFTVSQRLRSHFPYDDIEWRRWLNVDNGIYSRRGTPLLEMSEEQKELAMNLLGASLSERGVEQSQAIMLTDQALRELNPDAPFLDPELYYFTIMGEPSATEPWGWQLDGHHLVINYFVLGEQVVMTPTFWGGEPARSMQGSTTGNEVMQREQDLGLALMQSLDEGQQRVATLESRKTGDSLVAGAFNDNLVLDYAGLKAPEMSLASRSLLVELAEEYVGNIRGDQANIKMDEVMAHLDETYFAWIGATEDDAVFYYRIHSPVILIEFDHQLPVGTGSIHPDRVPIRDHIHTIVRTPNGNDYGKDLLAQHLAQSH